MCELKLRILLCSFFWAVLKMLYWRAEVKAWCVCMCASEVMYVNVKVVNLMGFTLTNLEPLDTFLVFTCSTWAIFPRCRIPCGILYLQFFYTMFFFFFSCTYFCFFSIETQSANIELSKNKVPKNSKQNEKKRKKQN